MNTLKDEVYTLERALLQPEVRRSARRLDTLLDDDFREFGASGRVYDKADILRALPAEDPAAYEIGEFEVRPLCGGVVLATYRVVRTSGGMAAVSLRSSIWKHDGSAWRVVFHQGTPCSPLPAR